MHIHLPKPLHGWREFLGEVGIIVVGVVIALGLEQVVEAIHWRHKAEQATSALRNEIGRNYEQAAEQLIAGPCIDRQLELLENALIGSGETQKAEMFHDDSSRGFTFRAPSRPWMTDVWRSVVSEGISSHLDGEFRAGLASYYTQIDLMHAAGAEADTLNWRLRSLALLSGIDSATKARLVEQIEEERGRYDLMTLVSGQLIKRARDLKMVAPDESLAPYLARSGTLQFCRAHNLPLGTLTPRT